MDASKMGAGKMGGGRKGGGTGWHGRACALASLSISPGFRMGTYRPHFVATLDSALQAVWFAGDLFFRCYRFKCIFQKPPLPAVLPERGRKKATVRAPAV
ncbi:hypothetical protein [Xanthobacter autotrophicus]|uniref:hypothetical protein n=1 Tax=Xanthobacter autotrophicus TaxID=280 RepID=UPI0037299FC4